jgi:EF-P beta-lysylation protein EpmB
MIPPGLQEPNTHDFDDTAAVTGADCHWRHELRTAFRSVEALCAALELDPADVAGGAEDSQQFPLLVPRSFVERMRSGDPNDPLLRQVLSLQAERTAVRGFGNDPLAESRFASDGVLRKYARRALLITTGACPIHCRYCFRRHFPYSDQLAARERWGPALAKLREMPDVDEVILSGGDPLSLSTPRLRELIEGLDVLDTITTLRIHTRFPVVLPARITQSLLDVLRDTRLRIVVVIHSNHANELLGDDISDALHRLGQSVDLLLNQSVLLRGINDSSRALCDLSNALFDNNVLPYYLHMLDRVSGSAHFEVAHEQALELVHQLRNNLPGYLVPKLVREVPDALSKTPVF